MVTHHRAGTAGLMGRGRGILLLAAISFLAATTWRCQGRPPDDHRPILIEFWTPDSEQDRIEVQEALAREFSDANPRYAVKVVGVPENLFPERLSAYQAGGRLPEVVRIGLELAAEYAGAGTADPAQRRAGLLDTEAATRVVQDLGPETFSPVPLGLLMLPDGRYAAVPVDGWVQAVWYRRDWFERRDLPAPDTWSHLLAGGAPPSTTRPRDATASSSARILRRSTPSKPSSRSPSPTASGSSTRPGRSRSTRPGSGRSSPSTESWHGSRRRGRTDGARPGGPSSRAAPP